MRNRFFLALDAVLATLVVFVAFCARFEGVGWLPGLAGLAIAYVIGAIPLKLLAYWRLGLYSRLWRYASIADLEILLLAGAASIVVTFAIGLGLVPILHLGVPRVPIGILVIDAALTGIALALPRLLLRVFARRMRYGRKTGTQHSASASDSENRRILIAGAGSAGGMIAKELVDNPQLGLIPVGFLDDDVTKHGHRLHGLPVFGAMSRLEDIVQSYSIDEIITALPSARGKVIRDIMHRATAAGVRNRTVPGLYEILSGAKSVNSLRPIQIEDLLRREPIQTDVQQVSSLITGRTVLVTGAGGSIGSELCRQIARLNPGQLIALGRGENSIFELLQELRSSYPDLRVRPVIADVRDMIRLRAVFESAQPYTVFHAAAHKHVPLMESSVDEAILNNVLGTRNVAELSREFGVEHMVLVSTDKAVRPTSIMGATKRIAEATLCSAAARSTKSFVAVRFGNVLGSRGSVVPTFLRQIARGGPVTITHREMRRYFMTIPEAVQLVLQAGALGKGGEVFVLDMGDPVRISDLAEDLIRLSGLEVGQDIEISYTGMRPGEKLYEELFFGPDDATATSHPKVLKARDGHGSDESDAFIDRLIEMARRRAPETELRQMIHMLVPEYQHPSLKLATAEPEVRHPKVAERASLPDSPSGKQRVFNVAD